MRRKHQMVAFAAPGHVIAESAPVGGFALSPLDGDVFIESRHRCPPERHSIPAAHRIKENEARDFNPLLWFDEYVGFSVLRREVICHRRA
jgi:hypothetical protein